MNIIRVEDPSKLRFNELKQLLKNMGLHVTKTDKKETLLQLYIQALAKADVTATPKGRYELRRTSFSSTLSAEKAKPSPNRKSARLNTRSAKRGGSPDKSNIIGGKRERRMSSRAKASALTASPVRQRTPSPKKAPSSSRRTTSGSATKKRRTSTTLVSEVKKLQEIQEDEMDQSHHDENFNPNEELDHDDEASITKMQIDEAEQNDIELFHTAQEQPIDEDDEEIHSDASAASVEDVAELQAQDMALEQEDVMELVKGASTADSSASSAGSVKKREVVELLGDDSDDITQSAVSNTDESSISRTVQNPHVKMALEAFSKIGSKLIAAAVSEEEGKSHPTLSEKEYDLLKGILDQIKPPSAQPVQHRTTSTLSNHSRDISIDTKSDDVVEMDDVVSPIPADKPAAKRIKFNDSSAVISGGRHSFDGSWASRDSFIPNMNDEEEATDYSPTIRFNISAHRATPHSKVLQESKLIGRQATPFHKASESLPDSDNKKRTFFDYSQLDTEVTEDAAKKRLSSNFEKVSGSRASSLGSSAALPTQPFAIGSNQPFFSKGTTTTFVPQFKSNTVQFSNFAQPQDSVKASETSSLSYLEKRRLQRQAQSNPSATVAKQILDALSNISTPMEEPTVKPVLRITASASEGSTTNKLAIAATPAVEKPLSTFTFASNPVPPLNEPFKFSTNNAKPSTQPSQSSQSQPIQPPSAPFAGSFTFNAAASSQVEKAKESASSASNISATFDVKKAVSFKSQDEVKSNISQEPKTVEKKKAAVTIPDTPSNEFTFEEPMVVTDMDECDDILSSANRLESSIRYVFSPPSKATKRESQKSVTSSTAAPTVPKATEVKSSTTASNADSGIPNIWSAASNKDNKKCKVCLVMNKKDANKCVSCESPFEDVVPAAKETASSSSSVNIWNMKSDTIKCKACYVQNKKDATTCASCESPLDVPSSSTAVTKKTASTTSEAPKFQFGTSSSAPTATAAPAAISSGGFTFGAPVVAATSAPAAFESKSSGFVFGAASSSTTTAPATSISTSAAPSTGFTFGAPSTSVSEVKQAAAPTFSFGAPPVAKTEIPSSTGFSFNKKEEPPAVKEVIPVAPAVSSGFSFGSSSTATTGAPPLPKFTFGGDDHKDDSQGKTPVVPPLNFGSDATSTSKSFQFGNAAPSTNGDSNDNDNSKRSKRKTESEDDVAPSKFSGSSAFGFGSSAAAAPVATSSSLPSFTFGAQPSEQKQAEVKSLGMFASSSDNKPKDGTETKPFSFGATSSEAAKPAMANTTTSGLLFGAPPVAESAKPAGSSFTFGAAPSTLGSAPTSTALPAFGNSSFSSGTIDANKSETKSAFGASSVGTSGGFGSSISTVNATPSIASAPAFSFGGASTTANPFAPKTENVIAPPVETSSSTISTSGPFGQQSTSGFGATTSSATAATPAFFGTSAAANPFGAPPAAPAATSIATSNPFGSAFGNSVSSTAATSTPSIFGATPSVGGSGLFGAAASVPAATPFTTSSSSNNLFGGVMSTPAPSSAQPFGNASNGPFGGFGGSSSSGFGATSTPAVNPFGASIAQPQSNPFASSASSNFGGFNAPSAPTTNPSFASAPAGDGGSFNIGSTGGDNRRKVKVKRPGQA